LMVRSGFINSYPKSAGIIFAAGINSICFA